MEHDIYHSINAKDRKVSSLVTRISNAAFTRTYRHDFPIAVVILSGSFLNAIPSPHASHGVNKGISRPSGRTLAYISFLKLA